MSRFVIQRGLGFVYLLAFVQALNQFRPLAGENGLLPVNRFLNNISFKRSPSIFHWHYSDRIFGFIAWAGIFLSLVAFSGLSELGPLWVSMLIWFLLWAFYLSIVNIGQVFYGFGWESILLEAGFYAIFLGPLHYQTPFLMIIVLRWLVFRIEFGAGLIKMRGDSCWRKLTCMYYHHETQPLPNPLSWFFHHLPKSLHKIETLGNHVVQLGVVWFLFAPQPVASYAAIFIILTQSYLIISGNYSWLNWLTLILAFSGFSDSFFQQFISFTPPQDLASPYYFQGLAAALLIMVIYLSIKPVKNMISPRQIMNFSFNPWHLVNSYGAFGSVTQKRYEIIIEGTTDKEIDDTTQWQAYEFKGKPGNPERMPPQIAPYHLRLDWQIWFAAMSSIRENPWLIRLIQRLLENDKPVLKLLKTNPFGDKAPQYIRARLFLYRYTTPEERRETGRWWSRKYVQPYMPPQSLEDFRALNL
jgi:hypothetical protein